jgi:hypothetical protein
MIKKQFTLEQQQGVTMLIADGFQQICPFQQPTPEQVPSNVFGAPPQIKFLPKVCSSLCPHFDFNSIEVEQSQDEIRVELSCGSCKTIYIKEPIKNIETDKKGNVLTFNKQ